MVEADDLEQIEELGRGAYGVVDKMKHVPSGVIMAVKVDTEAAQFIFLLFTCFWNTTNHQISGCKHLDVLM